MKSLRFVRATIAVVSFLAIIFLFVDVSGFAARHLDFMARIQLVPAFLALNLAAILFLIVLTALFGRLYCSVICPLGIYQDLVSRLRKVISGKRKRKVGIYKYGKAYTKLRVVVLGCFVVVLILALLNVMALTLGAFIEPYSAFGRIVTAFVSPLYDMGNNYLADVSAADGEYLYTPVHRVVPAVLFVIAAITLVAVSVCAWVGGRIYCNSICPVGTVLGYASKFSLFKIRINNEKCNSCGSCARHCKAECIDSKNHEIDYTRCIDCFDCLNSCKQGAISYIPPVHKKVTKEEKDKSSQKADNKGRRVFLASLATLTGAIVAESAGNVIEKTTDGGLTPLKKRPLTPRKVRIVPPGAISQAHINAHCVGCQLCIQACPNGLLKMSTDISTLMQPVMNYETDYCLPTCTECSNVCPAGVFKPLDTALKSSWKIGTAVVDASICISASGVDFCGNCSRHCPAGAIEMVEVDGDEMPVVNESLCIGCGACEVHCPVGTVASMKQDRPAIHVEGITTQRMI